MICDCLNTCGDDPWLKDGRVQPCKNFIKREQQDKLAPEKMAKVTKIAELYGAGADFDLVVLLHEKVQRLTAELTELQAALDGTALFEQSHKHALTVIERLTAELAEVKAERDARNLENAVLRSIVVRVQEKMPAYLAIYSGDKQLSKILDDCKVAIQGEQL